MTDTATARYGARQQSQGSNTNTWGDDKLNEVLRLFDRGSKGVQSIAMTGNTTLTWSNYAATNSGQCSVLTLSGSLSGAATLVVPSIEWQWDLIKNVTGQAITIKTSAGTGVAIPDGRQVPVYCDGADCYFAVPNYLGADITEANSRDVMDKAAVEVAIASANLPATAGTVLNSASDATAGYLNQKITVHVSTATTTQLGGLTSVQVSTAHGGGNEQLQIQVSSPYVGNFLDGGGQTLEFIPAQGTAYDVDCTSSAVTVNLGGMASVQLGQEIKLNKFGGYPMQLKGTVNGQTNCAVDTTSCETYRYSGVSWGWN